MKSNVISLRGARADGPSRAGRLAEALRRRIAGQDDAIDIIAPYVQLFESGLAPTGRPVGVFLLLGPTGTGKTRTVEALAEALHGHERHVLRVDCGEFQLDHEVAKLIGAPPGYLGHRETQPMISQQKLNAAASEKCPLSLVLFDEIEKAAGSLTRLLLGVLDKATLKLGDNTAVNFERSLIFLTSNLGAREMMDRLEDGFGFASLAAVAAHGAAAKMQAIATRAVRRRFSPEFVNRVDQVITYAPLGRRAFEAILDLQLHALREHLAQRLGARAFQVELSAEAREFLLKEGTSTRYGARELKRALHRHVIQKVAGLVVDGLTHPGGIVRVEKARGRDELTLRPRRGSAAA
ncbi:MAG: AAA family ATPase [Bryobacteraceae bacterium]|nr:AAA family ATPase [Bryobacteraceae bacterium]